MTSLCQFLKQWFWLWEYSDSDYGRGKNSNRRTSRLRRRSLGKEEHLDCFARARLILGREVNMSRSQPRWQRSVETGESMETAVVMVTGTIRGIQQQHDHADTWNDTMPQIYQCDIEAQTCYFKLLDCDDTIEPPYHNIKLKHNLKSSLCIWLMWRW